MTKFPIRVAISLAVFWAVFTFASSTQTQSHLPEQVFLHCLKSSNDPNITEVVYTPEHPDFLSVLNFYIQNSRFLNNKQTPKPKLIVAPSKGSEVQTVIKCGKMSSLQIRIRSGGHDFEGSSYISDLVDVPEKVASFMVSRTLVENAVQLVHKAQSVSLTLPLEIYFSIKFMTVLSNQTNKPTVEATFVCTYRGAGGITELLSIMDRKFPELGVTKDDIFEMLWIQFVPFHNSYPIDDYVHYLTSRIPPSKPYFSAKADFVRDPVSETGVQGLMNKLLEVPLGIGQMEWTFWGGGIMDKIPESEIAFPHRGYLFIVFEVVYWNKDDTSATIEERIDWFRGFRREFGRYVPENPRPAYADYRDHDLGLNRPDGTTTVEEARKSWGGPYFGGNFDRLVRVKSVVDPENLFRNEQGFPVIELPSSQCQLTS
ncbi:OLC1v1025154C1 [Oldenlandia corymbosa var. corymbosa]|uniref:OLC1v1025154C1 n=1 Tax=Oldenlandia corymbosa var. corymbosa TaxID=529605 RepID=A0AAV1C4E8_OLDCO|nr:OLC1v1025154C1 [Oldenlandia corymbosa var. corymbosa]